MDSIGPVRQAVILAGGRGSRMLPFTRVVPKELLPVADRPLIQRAVEEAAEAGAGEVVIVTAPANEGMLRQYFTPGPAGAGASPAEEDLRRLLARMSLRFVRQEVPLGIADALRCARPVLDDGSPFLLILPDGVMLGESVGRLLAAAVEGRGGSAVAVSEVSSGQVHRYGIVDGEPLDGRVWRLRRIVEKPRRPEDAPTRLGVIGRYLLAPAIFDAIGATPPGRDGELQISDALVTLATSAPVFAVRYDGDHIDAGQPDGLLAASLAVARREGTFPGLVL